MQTLIVLLILGVFYAAFLAIKRNVIKHDPDCPICEGQGYFEWRTSDGMYHSRICDCYNKKVTGPVADPSCVHCNGTGYVTENVGDISGISNIDVCECVVCPKSEIV